MTQHRRTRAAARLGLMMAACLVVAASAQAELIVHYSFDVDHGPGETVQNDANPGTYDGTLQADAFTSAGVLALDGTGDYLQSLLPTNGLTSPATILFWMSADTVQKSPLVSGYASGNVNRWDIQLDRLGSGKVGFVEHQASGWVDSTTAVAPGTWYHVAIVHDKPGDGEVHVFVNGVEENSRTLGYDLQTGINLKIGDGDGIDYHGSLDDVAIWNNEVLSSGQIKGIYEKKAVAIDNGDWATASTWFGQPGAGTDALIVAGKTVTIGGGTATAKDIFVGSADEAGTLAYNDGTLDVDSITVGSQGTVNSNKLQWTYTKVLNVEGGTVDQNNGYLAFNGGAQVTLAGAAGRIECPYGYLGFNSGTSTLHQTGGTLSTPGDFALGRYSGATGEYTLDDGLLEVRTSPSGSPGLRIARLGTGTLTQNGGHVLAHYGGVSLGEDGGNGTYHMNGGTLTTPALLIGTHTSGSGIFNYNDGTLNADAITVGPSGTLNVNRGWTYTKALNVDGGTVDATGQTLIFDDGAQVTMGGAGAALDALQLRVGNASANQALFTQTDGLVAIATGQFTYVGTNTGSNGKLVLGGTAHFQTPYLMVGNNGTGRVEVSGNAHLEVTSNVTNFRLGAGGDGTIIQTGGLVSQPSDGAMYLGYNPGAVGRYTISGGTLDQGSLTIGGNAGGKGYFTQTGGEVIAHRDVRIGRGPAGYGEYTISGGTLTVSNSHGNGSLNVGFDGTGTGVFTQTDGLVDVAGSVILGNTAGNTGTYTISGGALDVDASLIVGNSGTGLFHIIGDDATINVDGYTQGAGGTLELDINGISPIIVDGAVALAGALDVEFIETPLAGQEFLIIDNDGTDTVAGIFAGMGEGAAFMVQGFDCTVLISYEGGTGNDVVLTTTPEPTTLTLLGLGALAMLIRRRRRR